MLSLHFSHGSNSTTGKSSGLGVRDTGSNWGIRVSLGKLLCPFGPLFALCILAVDLPPSLNKILHRTLL